MFGNNWRRAQRLVAQQRLAEKGPQQRVVTGAGFMHTGDDCIDDPQFRSHADPVATPFPPRTIASRAPAASRARTTRTTVVPMAIMGPPRARASLTAAAVFAGIEYRSSNGSRLSSVGSPVEEIPAAWVWVAKRMPRVRLCQFNRIVRKRGRGTPARWLKSPTAATAFRRAHYRVSVEVAIIPLRAMTASCRSSRPPETISALPVG